jgi:hypothetical protein
LHFFDTYLLITKIEIAQDTIITYLLSNWAK